jgi:hypothetical protein
MRGTAKSDYELLQDEMRQLKRENAALRADKERMDWLLKDDVMRFGFVYHDRDSIDAGRKAEQP